MAARPANLIYGVDDVPPAPVLFVLALRHIFLMSSTLVLPIVLVSEISGDFTQTQAVVALTMISCGIGTVLQACRWRGIGSGFLCPNLCGPNFFASCMAAAWLGGLPLMRGMTIAAGLIEIAFARVLHRLAFLFPAQITGLVVFMVALSLVPVGSSNFLHVAYAGEPIQPLSLSIAGVTLLVMVGINIWGASQLKLYGLLIGLVIGYALSGAAGLIDAVQYHNVRLAPWIGLPRVRHAICVYSRKPSSYRTVFVCFRTTATIPGFWPAIAMTLLTHLRHRPSEFALTHNAAYPTAVC